MPQDASAVQQKLARLEIQNLSMVSKELAALPDLLYANEDMYAVTSGLIGDKTHLLVVTNTRILMLYIGLIGGLKTLELPLSQVKSVSYTSGLLLADLLIDTGGQTQKLKNSPKANAQAVANAVSRLLNTPQESTVPQQNGVDVVSALERLTELRDKGVLTSDEFAAQKGIILGSHPPIIAEVKVPVAMEPSVEPEEPTPLKAQDIKVAPKRSSWLKKIAYGCIVLLVLGYIVEKMDGSKKAEEKKASSEVAQGQQGSQDISDVTGPLSTGTKGIPLNYAVLKRDEEVRASIKRNRLRLTIIPTQDQSAATQADLAATVASVAIQEQKKSGIPVVIVNMLCQQAANSYGELQLAHAVYIPDGKGFDGKTAKPVWETLSAAPRGFTAQELEYLRLWAEMRANYQQDGSTNDKALSAAIEKRMGIKAGDLNPHFNVVESVEKKLDIAEPAQEKALVTQNVEKGDSKEFTQRLVDIVIAYDDVVEKLLNVRPLHGIKAKKTNAKNYRGFVYSLTPNVALLFCIDHEKNKPFAVKAIGVEDGTEQTRALIVLNCIGLIAAVTPDWTGDERGRVAKKLGITTTFPVFGNTTTAEYKNMKFSFANNGENGITLTIEPSVTKQKTTPPPAPKQPQKQKQQNTSPRSRYSPEVDSLLGEPL